MDILRADAEALCQRGLKTACIQNGAGADDLTLRQAGDLCEHIGQHVDRVGDDDIDRIRRSLDDLRRDVLDDIDVGLRQIQTALTGLSRHTGGDDHNVRALGVLIVAGTHDRRRTERRALINIQCLAECLLLVDIDQQDLRCDSLDHQIVGNGRADAARANNSDFAHEDYHPFKIAPAAALAACLPCRGRCWIFIHISLPIKLYRIIHGNGNAFPSCPI